MKNTTKILFLLIAPILFFSFFLYPKEAKAEIFSLRGYNTTDFYMYSPTNNSWVAKASIPSAAGYGASLVYPGTGDYIYALFGNYTTNFYRYSISTNTWSVRTSIPVAVGAGGSLAYPSSGDYIYALPGNGSTSFYRYSISGNAWTSRTAITTAVGAGGGLAYPGTGDYLYALIGNTTTTFYRYSISGNAWSTRAVVPSAIGGGGKLINSGSTDYLYAIQGNNSGIFYRYSVSGNTWVAMTNFPVNAFAGTSMVYYAGTSNYIYALRGYNSGTSSPSAEFYRYNVSGNSWESRTAIPGAVYYGAGMVGVPSAPGAPSGLTVAGASATQINLSWTAPTDNGGSAITGYKIERESPVGGGWTTIVANTGNTNVTYSNTGIVAGTQYNYRVSAINAVGAGSLSNEANITLAAPGAPTGLAVSAFSSTVITLYWTAPASNGGLAITGYKIERESPIGGGWTTIVANTGDINTAYANTGLTVGNEYNYRVSAVNAIGAGSASNEDSVMLLENFASGIYVLQGRSTVNFYKYIVTDDSWSKKADISSSPSNGASLIFTGSGNYIYALKGNNTTSFYRYDVSANTWSSLTAITSAVGAGASSVYPGSGDYIYVLTGNNSTSFYRYSISANTWATRTSAPLAVSASSLVYPGSGDCIYAFAGLHSYDFYCYSISANTWTDKADNYLDSDLLLGAGINLVYPGTGDYIYALTGNSSEFFRYSISANTWSTRAAFPVGASAGTSLSYPGLGDYIYATAGADTNFFYRYSISANTWTTRSSVPANVSFGGASVAYIYVTAPEASTDLVASAASPTQINLSWTAPGNGGSAITGYKIERESPVGGGWSTLVANTGNANTTYNNTGVTTGVQYNYRVSAINVVGAGIPSNSANATTVAVATAPGTPTGLTVTQYSPSQINLSWTAPNNGGSLITGYKIERENPIGGGWTTIVENTGNANTNYQNVGSVIQALGAAGGSTSKWVCNGLSGGATSSVCTATRAAAGPSIALLPISTNYCLAQGAGSITFSWTYSDESSYPESRFQFQVDDSSSFDSLDINRDYTGLSNPSGTTNFQSATVSVSPAAGQLSFGSAGVGKTYYWRVKAYNNQGGDTGWISGGSFLTEPNAWPAPSFTYLPTLPLVNKAVNFTDTSMCYDTNNQIQSCATTGTRTYLWNFGDGNTSAVKGDVTNIYTLAKTYSASLKVCEGTKCCTTSQNITTKKALNVPEWKEISPF